MLLRTIPLLLPIFCPLVWAKNYSEPHTAEIDLVFPLNETYVPIYPFPIVFALRNPATVWPFDFQFRYYVEVYNEKENRFMTMIDGFEDYGHFPHASNEQDVEYFGEDPLVVVNATKMLLGLNETYGYVRWAIGPIYNCSDDAPFEEDVDRSDFFENQLYFSLSRNGTMPDFSKPLPCPERVGALSIDGQMLPTGPQHNPGTCAILSEEQPKGDPCGLKLPDNMATRVSDVMLDWVGCEEGVWPNPTATTCEEMSGSSSLTRPFLAWIGTVGLTVACISIVI